MTFSRLLSICGLSVFLLTVTASAQSPELQQLHDALHLRADQEAGWDSYARTLTMDPQEAARRRDFAERMPRLSAPERVDLSVQMMQADLAGMERRGAALKAFYATLSPEQQQAFDRATMRPPQGTQ
jgi:periplasmic protein CpxP/Spy